VAAPAKLTALAEARATARSARDWPEADRLRGEIEAAGWEVRDTADPPFFRLVPRS
jgi:cysteinyl-tRNA synthetase